MDAPKTIKDVQKLTGCMAALNRFIFQLGERGLPFFKLLKLYDKFKWTEEANQALQDLKHHLQSPSILTAPNQAKTCSSTSLRLFTSSVRQSWWKDRKKATPSRCSGQFTSSVKFSLNLRFVTQQFRKYFMVYPSLPGSFATTLMHIISSWSPTSHWRISSTIGTLSGASPSGQWS
jgi:hypothetical protein